MEQKQIPCEVFTRTCGYFRPVQKMNDGKVAEYNNRVEYEAGTKNLDQLKKCDDIIVVSSKNCSVCDKVKTRLQEHKQVGSFIILDITEKEAILELYKSRGLEINNDALALPIVFYPNNGVTYGNIQAEQISFYLNQTKEK